MNNLKCSKGSQIRRSKENGKLRKMIKEAAFLDHEDREEKSDVIQLTVEELGRLRIG
jgi:predicted ATPase